MPSIPFQDDENMWMGNYLCEKIDGQIQPPDGGMVIQDVTHNSFNFAKDIRTIGIRINYERTERLGYYDKIKYRSSVFYPLDRTYFDFEPLLTLYESSFKLPEALDGKVGAFELYDPVYGFEAHYTSKSNFFENCDAGKLMISQYYLFSRYSNSPPHEPGGILTAARFIPLIYFRFEKEKINSAVYPQNIITSIRFDTRLHLNVDEYSETPKPKPKGTTSLNFAGVFKDEEKLGLSIPPKIAEFAFEKAEKPLIYEIAAAGYRNGTAGGWDNIHWWGWAPEIEAGGGQKFRPHISAPGAFHAVHTHWRWGGAIRDAKWYVPYKVQEWADNPDKGGTKEISPTKHGYDPQFKGFPNANSPLIDPSISNQSLEFAVTKNRPELNPAAKAMKDLSEDWFFYLFEKLGAPAKIDSGEELVMWIAIEAFRDISIDVDSFHGDIFIHGLFFAHEPEPSWTIKTGGRDTEYFPTDKDDIENKWTRY